MPKHSSNGVNRSVRLAPLYWGRIEELAALTGLSQSNVMAIAIDRMYEREIASKSDTATADDDVNADRAASLWETWADGYTFADVASIGAKTLEQHINKKVTADNSEVPPDLTPRRLAVLLRAYAMWMLRMMDEGDGEEEEDETEASAEV